MNYIFCLFKRICGSLDDRMLPEPLLYSAIQRVKHRCFVRLTLNQLVILGQPVRRVDLQAHTFHRAKAVLPMIFSWHGHLAHE